MKSQLIRPIVHSEQFTDKQVVLLCKLIKLIATYDPKIKELHGTNLFYEFQRLYKLSIPELSEADSLSFADNEDQHLTIEDLLLTYDKNLAVAARKQSGSFFSPVALVDLMLNHSLSLLGNLEQLPKTLDPACGSGIFIVSLIDKLAKQHNLFNLINWLNVDVFAVDINNSALIFTQLGIIAKLWELTGNLSTNFEHGLIRNCKPKLLNGNFLLTRPQLTRGLLSNNEQDAIKLLCVQDVEILNQANFDLVIGNPPYGLSRDCQISKLENDLLKDSYQSSLSGKPNKFLLFIARAYELLSSRGTLTFVTPNSWLGVKSAEKLRIQLLADNAFHSIFHFNELVFEDVGVEAIITILSKAKKDHQINIRRLQNCSAKKELEHFQVSNKLCEKVLNSRIPLVWSQNADLVFNRIHANSTPLKDYSKFFSPAIALQAYAEGKGTPPQSKLVVKSHPFHALKQENETYLPYLVGKDVNPYKIDWSGQYLSYGPWLAEPQKLERFTAPRIVIREILGKYPYLLSACYTEATFLYNKSCLHIVATQEERSPDMLKALLAILNSSLSGFIILHSGHKSQRSMFPKIVNADLLDFPIPIKFTADYLLLSKLVGQIMLQKDTSSEVYNNLRQEIDIAVIELYALDKNTNLQLSCFSRFNK